MTERKSADERTADLLLAAERVLHRDGRMTVSELAREAGIANGTFYLYFPSKGHLEATLIEQFIRGYSEEVEAALDSGLAIDVRLTQTLAAIVVYANSHKAVLRLQATHCPTAATREIIAEGVDRLTHLLGGALRTAVADREIALADPELTAGLLFHGVEGLLKYAVAFERPIDHDRIVAAVRDHVTSLLNEGVTA